MGNPGGGKPVTLARATLPKAKLESWKGILGATGIGQPPWRGATLAGATLAGATLAGATLTAATLLGNLAGATWWGFGFSGLPPTPYQGGFHLHSPRWPGWDVLLLLLEPTLSWIQTTVFKTPSRP